MEFGWKNFVNNLKNWADDWENYDGNWKNWVEIGGIIGMMEVACTV